jgi:hypothetical protein
MRGESARPQEDRDHPDVDQVKETIQAHRRVMDADPDRLSRAGAGGHRRRSVCELHATLSRKVRGHYAYYGITGNMRALTWFL